MTKERAARVAGPATIRLKTTRAGGAGLYIRALAIVTLGLVLYLVFAQVSLPRIGPSGPFPWASFVFLMILAVLAETCTVRIGSGMELSASFLTFFLSGAIAGPLAALAVAVASQIFRFRLSEWERHTCFISTAGIVAGGSSLLYWAALSWVGGFENAAIWKIISNRRGGWRLLSPAQLRRGGTRRLYAAGHRHEDALARRGEALLAFPRVLPGH